MGADQSQQPLFEIGSVVTPIAIDDGNGDRFLFWLVLRAAFSFCKLLSIHAKRGGIDMHLVGLDAEALPGLQGQSGKQSRHIMLIEPIEGSSQTIIIEHVRRDPLSQ
jgi:hypothetical protein